MKHFDVNSVVLANFPSENQLYIADWAGFPPFVRGNSVCFTFPELVSKTDFEEVSNQNGIAYLFENKKVIEISSLENISHLQKIFSENISEEKIVFLSRHITFSLETVAFVRAIRAVNSLFSENNTIRLGIELTLSSLENLPFMIASMPEFIVCEQEVKQFIFENKSFIDPHTIDPFGGNIYLEEKTKFFIAEILG